jgi:hypothetical protein
VPAPIHAADRDHARSAVFDVLERHQLADDGARVRLSGAPCADGPALLQVNLRVCGASARVQLAGRGLAATIAAGTARLDRQITRLTTTWQPRPWPDPERPALSVPGTGAVVRTKAFRLIVGAPCQAVAAMDAMDYDCFLFTEADSGEDAVVYRAGSTGVRLARQRCMRPPSSGIALTVNSRKVPVLDVGEAATWLADGWLPFMFFTNRDSGRGNLLYRRYDGNVTLVRPA